MDGSIVKWQDATIHVLSHTMQYGLGFFDDIRCYETDSGPAIFRLREHIERLFDSAHVCAVSIPYSRQEIINAVLETVRANGLTSCCIRPLVYLGQGPLGLSPLESPVRVAIAVWPLPAAEEPLAGVRVKVTSFTRPHVNVLMSKVKVSGHYVNSILGKVEALRDGYDEAVFLDHNGFVTEGSGENLFIVRRKSMKTPSTVSVLPGITRDSIMELAKWLGVHTYEGIVTRDELYVADEVFLTGTTSEVTPVREVDRRVIGTGEVGPVTRQLKECFRSVVQGREPTFEDWLTRL
jgi:branched-chain amino acid aminotransferase